ncbi:MAG: VOC family protein [Planctomycetales bacterium]|nr:VOC family protein [Planctomycetales bacterium]
MQPRISMITLGVQDLSASIRFYTALGFPRFGDEENVAFFSLNGTWLGLYGKEALAEDAQVAVAGSGFPGFALAHNVSSPEEVDAVLKHAESCGAKLTKPGQKVFWGGYSGYFQDPDGYLWEVAHNPFAWIGPPDTQTEADDE